MAILIWIDGPICIGKTMTAQALLKRFVNNNVRYLDSDEYYTFFLNKQMEMVRQKQNEEKKGFDELIKIITPAFNNAYFIKYFKDVILNKIQSNAFVIVSMSLGTDNARILLRNPLVKSTDFHHVILCMDEEAHLQRIDSSNRENKELAKQWRKRMHSFALENYYDAIWIDVFDKTPEELADDILKKIEIPIT